MSANSAPKPDTGISLRSAIAVVVANMVGTGVFTSLGFQVGDLNSGFSILVLWAVGGVCAFCGALAYGELAACLPRSGGEYNFLAQTFHPSVGFVAGWLSSTVGFAAPVALAAMALSEYFAAMLPILPKLVVSSLCVIAVTWVHSRGVHVGARFQNLATVVKVGLILVFLVAGVFMGEHQSLSFLPVEGDWARITSPQFATSLVFVMYAYAGWNAATYIVDEVHRPTRNVPLAIGIGTLAVAALYMALNAVFLLAAPLAELKGQVDVGHVAADHIFGSTGGRIMSALICLGLISSISAMTWVGPRVTMVLGQDVRMLRWFSACNVHGVPSRALWTQMAVVLLLLYTSSFKPVLGYVQFSIQFCSFLTVIGLFWLRWKKPQLARPVRCWGYPVTPLIFLAVSLWMMVFQVLETPKESFAGFLTALAGLLLWFLSRSPVTESKGAPPTV